MYIYIHTYIQFTIFSTMLFYQIHFQLREVMDVFMPWHPLKDDIKEIITKLLTLFLCQSSHRWPISTYCLHILLYSWFAQTELLLYQTFYIFDWLFPDTGQGGVCETTRWICQGLYKPFKVDISSCAPSHIIANPLYMYIKRALLGWESVLTSFYYMYIDTSVLSPTPNIITRNAVSQPHVYYVYLAMITSHKVTCTTRLLYMHMHTRTVYLHNMTFILSFTK